MMTLGCLREFGIGVRTESDKFVVLRQRYQPARFEVEGDWTSASYFLALGALSEGIEVENLSTSSLQGDRVILDLLRNMGANIRVSGNSVTVSKGDLKAIRVDLADCIDLLPTMAVLAALAEGTSEFTGIERARIKESNRVAAVREGLTRMGVTVIEDKDRLTVAGSAIKKPGAGEEAEKPEDGKLVAEAISGPELVVIDSKGDHRIAMAFAILGTAVGGITIDGAECVSKTFPSFWDTLKSIGGKVEINAE
jgi:3-phosphoshikimate 1-carboxyvinyltransferase